MKSAMRRLIVLGLAIFGSTGKAAVETHCLAGEVPFLNALMSRVSNSGVEFERKLLSLCADKTAEPFEKFSYRFGTAGKVELEAVATPDRTFQIFNELVVEHLGRDVVSFQIGKFTYEVDVSTGMGHGVTLRVLANGSEVSKYSSGGIVGVDFELGPAEIAFDHPASPIFELVTPMR